ncbi:hypothetical protein ACF0H5_010285 [Mactra antiquata]
MLRVLILSLCAAATLAQSNILDVLNSRREHTLLDLIAAAGLNSTLAGPGPFTIFAPSEAAFRYYGSAKLNALKSDPTQLANFLKYHVVSGIVMSTDLMVNEKMLDSLAGTNIRVNYYMYNKHIAVEGARVTSSNIKASNGIIHIIDHVMEAPTGTIADIIASNSDFSTLKAAVDAAGLTSALQDGPYTMFAPNNAAFAALGDDKVNALLADPQLLKSILLYHVIHGTLYSTGMHSGNLHTLEQTDMERIIASYTSTRPITIDGTAHSVTKDISATNGVIHVIDHVLIPSSLKSSV